MKIEVWYESDVGLKREKNQDSCLVNQDLGLYLVADGMGGHKGGEVASQLSVDTIQSFVKYCRDANEPINPRELVQLSYSQASSKVYESSLNDPTLRGMGTTLVMVYCYKDVFYVGNVGDSRAYLIRNQNLWQLTEDHSLIFEQIKAGLWSEADMKDFPARNVITRSVGFEKNVECDILVREAMVGDKLLLCSDGLSGLVSDREIAETVYTNTSRNAVTKLIETAKKNGGDDNVTVMLLAVLD